MHSLVFVAMAVLLSLFLTSETQVVPPDVACPQRCTCSHGAVDCSHAAFRRIPDIPSRTQILILDNNPLVSLEADSFHNLSSLKQLSLQNCRLSSINNQTFQGMVNLVTLILAKNKLTELPSDVFTDQTQLENLVLSGNQLTLSSVGHSITKLHNLKYLDIELNPVEDGILKQEFGEIKTLQTMMLHGSEMSQLSAHFFDVLANTSLSTLVLSGTFDNVSENALVPLTSLRTFDISNTTITPLMATNLLSGLGNMTGLHTLNMDDTFNKYKHNATVHKHFFQHLIGTELAVLYFRGNHYAFKGILQHRLFKYLHYLIYLYLDSCALDAVHSDAFVGLNKLKFLSLKGNLLTCHDKQSCGFLTEKTHNSFPSLLTLDLSDNNIDIYKHGLSFHGSAFNNLKQLYLSNNKLSKLQFGMFKGLKHLRLLDLSGNPIAVVESGTFTGLTNMITLWINRTGILDNLPPKMFQGCHKLQLLDMSLGDISRIDRLAFKGIRDLQYLDLRGNYLHSNGSLTNVTIDSPYLWKLDLGENKLTSIPELVTTSRGLKQLFMDMNYLTDESLSGLVNNSALEILDLSYNSITHICPSFVASHPKLCQLLMEENPFVCDCDFDNIGEDLKHSNITIVRIENHQCTGPPSMRGQNIFGFSPSKWECGVKTGVIPLICVLVILLVFIVMVLVKRSSCEVPHIDIKECCNLAYCYERLKSKSSDAAFLTDQDTRL